MKRRILAMTTAIVTALSCNVYAAKTTTVKQGKTAQNAKTVVSADVYNYDWDYNDFTNQFTWKSELGDKVFISGDKMVLFNNSGRQTNTSKFSLSGQKPKTYFTEGNYHYFLTGKLEKNKLVYRLNKVDEYSHVKTAEISLDLYLGFDYKGAFSDIPVRYSWDERSAVFEICPDAVDTRRTSNEKTGYLRRSPMVYIAYDLAAMKEIDVNKEYAKISNLKGAMYNGKYDSTPYAKGEYDFVLGGNKQDPKLFFNGTQPDNNAYTKTDEPQNYGNNPMFKSIYDSSKAGLFICIATTKSSSKAPVFDDARLMVKAENNKDSLIVGDITEYGDAIVTTGKDGNGFKNAYVSYYNTETGTSKKTYITQYSGGEGIKVSTPYLFTYESYGIVVWYETKNNITEMKFAKLKKSGGLDGSINTVSTAGIVPVRPLNNNVYIYYITRETDGVYKISEVKYK